MTAKIMLALSAGETAEYQDLIVPACADFGVEAAIVQGPAAAAEVDFLVISPAGHIPDFASYPRLRAVLSIWAGVEQLVGNPQLAGIPLCRMVDTGLTEAMREYVAGHVLRYHLGMDTHITRQDGQWRSTEVAPLASGRSVGILGLGTLGTACAELLVQIGFQVNGWSRRQADLPGVTCRSGPDGLQQTLAASEILVTLLPDTPTTENILNARSLAWLPGGARIINPGRGPLIDDADLLAAIASGHIAHATLDVFRVEPLPPDHDYWSCPHVTVTPHIAAATRPETAVRTIAENIRRALHEEPLLYQVDITAGY